MELEDVIFNGENLNEIVGAKLYNHDFDQLPSRDLSTFQIARENSSVVTSALFTDKTITIDFLIQGCTHPRSQSIMSNLKRLTHCMNKTLQVRQGQAELSGSDYIVGDGITTEYREATLNGVTLSWLGGNALFTLTFFVADPIGYGDLQSFTIGPVKDTSTYDVALTGILGTFSEQRPVINMFFISATYPANPSLRITDGLTTLELEGEIPAGSTVIVDSAEKTVTVDGIPRHYNGTVPLLKPPATTLQFIDNYTARAIVVAVANEPRYI
jgi:hypothetical protein